jgi:hypothetical protein
LYEQKEKNPPKIFKKKKKKIPAELVLCQVDDVPFVSPKKVELVLTVFWDYRNLASFADVELAENSPRNEKAIGNQKRGNVPGILFDSTDLSW